MKKRGTIRKTNFGYNTENLREGAQRISEDLGFGNHKTERVKETLVECLERIIILELCEPQQYLQKFQ